VHLDKLKDEENFFSSFGIAIRSVYSGAGDIVGGLTPHFAPVLLPLLISIWKRDCYSSF